MTMKTIEKQHEASVSLPYETIESLKNEKKEAKLAEEIKVNQREESAKKAELIFTEYLTPEKKEELKKWSQ